MMVDQRFIPALFVALFLFPSLICAGSARCHDQPFFFGVALDGYPITQGRLKQIGKDIGIRPKIVVFFLQWPPIADQQPAPFPGESLDAVWNFGAIPCLTWEPMHVREGHEVMVPWQDIVSGAYDVYLNDFAKKAGAWHRPFMIRFAHEMNIERYHWGTERADYGPESPRIYREMFQYVVRLFRQAGARNVVWVFCPNAESVPDRSYDATAVWNRIEDYYPGDAVVDVLGMDGYNWGTTQKRERHGWDSQWREFTDIFQSPRETLGGLAPDKPLFVFETASVDQGGDKGLWIKKALQTARDWGLTGLVWFHVNKEYDWRISAGQAASYENLTPKNASPHDWIMELVTHKQTGLAP
jgi:mannan endo-1,4-beta-mannosidase